MALMHGKLGRIEWDCDAARTQLTLAQSWTCDVTHEVFEITSMQDTWKTYLGGYRDWTATCECLQDTSGPIIKPFGPGNPNGFADVEAYLELYLKYDAGNTEWRMVFGKCICNGESMSTDNGIATITYTFQGTDMLAWDSESINLHVY
jgi:hypothetical protein